MIADEIVLHAKMAYPKEACGLVCDTGTGLQYFPCRNLATSLVEFSIHPQDYVFATNIGKIVAVVHSHPDGTPEMSPADEYMFSFSTVDWIIIAWPSAEMVRYPCSQLQSKDLAWL